MREREVFERGGDREVECEVEEGCLREERIRISSRLTETKTDARSRGCWVGESCWYAACRAATAW